MSVTVSHNSDSFATPSTRTSPHVQFVLTISHFPQSDILSARNSGAVQRHVCCYTIQIYQQSVIHVSFGSKEICSIVVKKFVPLSRLLSFHCDTKFVPLSRLLSFHCDMKFVPLSRLLSCHCDTKFVPLSRLLTVHCDSKFVPLSRLLSFHCDTKFVPLSRLLSFHCNTKFCNIVIQNSAHRHCHILLWLRI